MEIERVYIQRTIVFIVTSHYIHGRRQKIEIKDKGEQPKIKVKGEQPKLLEKIA